MRNRASLVLFIFLILLLVILAQNGMLGNLFAGTGFSVGTPLPTVRPLVFTTVTPTPRGQMLPPPNLPTAYQPPMYAPTAFGQPSVPTQPGQQPVGQTPVPTGVVSTGGQCVVPNGWVPYTISAGDTLAGIATAYNLTVQQLAQANCLQNPDLIFEGQVIAVPGQ
jgi:nucleoid-associated protein YgaU